ncbi:MULTISPECIES: hypothetical protein [Campylobacter]|uniref:Uncharacterized protein n=1 Tax=Campylobacter jejuni subsp. jejuni serotype O:23/36 (strain 81-176) TaxID=354242 RepID=Q8GJE8_CAMJJ|nr:MULTISPECIES: hypothetical protein [Campylobacter]AAN46900.1 unknown [Campylobacter jejuni subsp. jejuni 81-176]AJK83796.1 hypothetical protein PJ19_09670 [Campylobacter jejuni subsp. jejuni]AJK85680.1 hypothetical protein PJ16_09685 [Campylobacter jejuni subsp. jejuni]AXL29675.1 hypothetical protein AEI02_09105 [Campylobacter jejuni]EAC1437936.1 hypothetical protein [Campylobacter jejuni]
MQEISNYEKIKKDIEEGIQKRKEEDKKNKKIINQIKIISSLENKVQKEKEKLDKLVKNETKELENE